MSDRSDEAVDSTADEGEERIDVSIDAAVHDRVAARVERSDFDSPARYIEFAMEEVLARVEGEKEMSGSAAADLDGEHEAADNDEVESRLESLGYM